MTAQRPLRLGMIGAGRAPISAVSTALPQRLDAATGCRGLRCRPARGRDFAIAQGLDLARSYGSYQDLIAGEAARGDPVDAVAICTPNFTHYPISEGPDRGRVRRDLGESFFLPDRDAGRCRGAGKACARVGPLCRREDLYLLRLSDGP